MARRWWDGCVRMVESAFKDKKGDTYYRLDDGHTVRATGGPVKPPVWHVCFTCVEAREK